MAQMNRQLSGIETIFIPTSSTTSFMASWLLREVARYGGDGSAVRPQAGGGQAGKKFGTERRILIDDDPLEAEEHALGDDAEGCLQRAIDLVSTPAPCRSRRRCSSTAGRVLDLLQGALDRLPDELRRARWLLRERDEFMAEDASARRTSSGDVRAQAERMVAAHRDRAPGQAGRPAHPRRRPRGGPPPAP